MQQVHPLLLPAQESVAQDHPLILTEKGNDPFPLSVDGHSTPFVISNSDYEGAIRTFHDLKKDIGRVTGSQPTLIEAPFTWLIKLSLPEPWAQQAY